MNNWYTDGRLVSIPKLNDDRNNYPAWKWGKDNQGNRKPIIYCACGKPMGVDSHNIDDQGNITPSFFHRDNEQNDLKGCQYHVYLVLQDYAN